MKNRSKLLLVLTGLLILIVGIQVGFRVKELKEEREAAIALAQASGSSSCGGAHSSHATDSSMMGGSCGTSCGSSCGMESMMMYAKAAANLVEDPVCHKVLNPETATIKSQYQGKTFYFCCHSCQKRFLDAPKRYAEEAAKKPKLSPPANFVEDPVCKAKLLTTSATVRTTYKNKTYYFCCGGCLKRFESNPQAYVK